MKKVIIVNPYAGSFSDELKLSNVEELSTYLNDGWLIEREIILPVSTGKDYRRLGSVMFILYKPKPNPSFSIGDRAYHKEIYKGEELMEITGIKVNDDGNLMVELKGDYSGGTHNTVDREWFKADGLKFKN